ncbi:MAG TPA: MarR family winged helix-turn-helix transcriptional regulator [Patescibacteria group bacterium]|nr:MarR family winged helix-turn-helix transcriptional regulator [Patescibacteria group bacterium]
MGNNGNTVPQQMREMIRLLMRRLGVLEKSEAACCRMTMAQCHALVEIGRAGTLSLNALADFLGLDKSTVSRSVENLVVQGLAERQVDPEDRRYVQIALTPAGRTLYQETEQSMVAFYQEVYAAIPVERRQQVLESMNDLLAATMKVTCCRPEE